MSETQRSHCVTWLGDVHCNLVRSENDLHGVKSMAGDGRGKEDDPLSQRYIGQLRKLMIINYEQTTRLNALCERTSLLLGEGSLSYWL